MKRVRLLVLVFVLLGLSLNAQAAKLVDGVGLPSAAQTSAGGLHVALPGAFDAFFTNPCGFATNQRYWGLFGLTVNLSGPVIDVLNQVPSMMQGSFDLGKLLTALMDNKGRLYAAMDAAGPLAFGYVGQGLGFGFFNRTFTEINVSSPLSASLKIREELIFAGGYARAFSFANGKQAFEFGIMPKGFVRAELGLTDNLLSISTIAQKPEALLDTIPLVLTTGAGFDAGLSWRYDTMFALSLVGRDAFTPANVTSYASTNAFLAGAPKTGSHAALVPANLIFGLYYAVKADFLRRLGVQWEWMLDYRDILDLFNPLPRNPILNVGLGTRVTILDIVQLGIGINETLPSVGFSLSLGYTKLALSVYGRERGLEPGDRPAYNMLISLNMVY